jgi:hypothetical protein
MIVGRQDGDTESRAVYFSSSSVPLSYVKRQRKEKEKRKTEIYL